MRRLTIPRILALVALVTVAAAAAEACSRCRQCAPCVVYVQVPSERRAEVPEDTKSRVIRALVIADDNSQKDDSFNTEVNSDAFTIRSMLDNLGDLCPTVLTLSKKNVTRERILDAINYKLECGPDDTLFVYYSGHGKQEPQYIQQDAQLGHFLDLYISPPQAPYSGVGRWELIQAMNNRNPRLKVLITDSCFAASKPDDDTSLTPRFKGSKVTPAQDIKLDIVQHLLLDQSGLVNINSCQPSEKAYGNLFTPILENRLTAWPGKPNPTWEDFFDEVRDATKEQSKKVIEQQSPDLARGDGDKKEGDNEPAKVQTPFAFSKFSEVGPRNYQAEEKTESVASAQR
jgi:hypothetical protein